MTADPVAHTAAQRIPLSELREYLDHLSVRPAFAEATRRERLEQAVLWAKAERYEAASYARLIAEPDAEPAAGPATETEELPL